MVVRCTLIGSGVDPGHGLRGSWVERNESGLRRPSAMGVRQPRSDGRPAFGIGPISRVPTMAAMGRGGSIPGRGSAAAAGRGAAAGARGDGSAAAGGPSLGTMHDRSPGYTAPGPSAPAGRVYTGAEAARARAFGLPNLRRNVCPHFYMTGARGAIPIHAPHLLKALVRQDATTSRCQLRGGVHLEQGYVNDVCLSPRFNQCAFYEEDLTSR